VSKHFVYTFSHLLSVSLTQVVHLELRISFRKIPNGALGKIRAWEEMIHEKNVSKKYRGSVPLNQ